MASQEAIFMGFIWEQYKVNDLGNWQAEQVRIWTPVKKWPLLRIGPYFVWSSFLLLEIEVMDDALVICNGRVLGVTKWIKAEMKNNIEITLESTHVSGGTYFFLEYIILKVSL